MQCTLPRTVRLGAASPVTDLAVGSYKPQLRNLDYAISHIKDEFDIDKEDILIVANSKLHDIQPCVTRTSLRPGLVDPVAALWLTP